MKVVIFCGGLGMRLREHEESIPKPLVKIGDQPILWHIMKYYAHFGYTDFIICLGWKANEIKQYFAYYDTHLLNNFDPSSPAEKDVDNDIKDWKITFVDTGLDATIGQRLKAIQSHLEGEETFLANYADGLTALHLPELINHYNTTMPIGLFLSVRPRFNSFHSVTSTSNGRVTSIEQIGESEVWMNGGFFIFNRKIFNYIQEGEDLVDKPFRRLIAEGQLQTLQYDGFWACMDTFKEKQMLEDLYAQEPIAPWEVWKKSALSSR